MEGRNIPHLREIFGGSPEQRTNPPITTTQPPPPPKGEDPGKHLERHLSMKKTIRKKIMRELQQAFVEDPTQLSGGIVEDKAAVNISFGKGGNFLDFLRRGEGEGETKQETPQQDKQTFWRRFTFRRTKR